jgi:hypothetical protein
MQKQKNNNLQEKNSSNPKEKKRMKLTESASKLKVYYRSSIPYHVSLFPDKLMSYYNNTIGAQKSDFSKIAQ